MHTAGTSSQITDGAAAVLLMTAATARKELGLRPRARIVDQCLVGVDPVLMLTGPIDATRHLLDRTGLTIDDIDTDRDQRGVRVGRARVGARARARPGEGEPQRRRDRARSPGRCDRRRLITTALHELERIDGTLGARHDVLRRRARHRHDHRAAVSRCPPGACPLAERLGYAPDDKLLIINCDDLGSSHAANVGVYDALRSGAGHQRHADGAVPVGARRRRAVPRRGRRRAPHAQRRVGALPLGPDHPRAVACSTATAASPARSTTCGTTPTSTRCARECRAQIERAILWGFDVSHLD